MTSHGKTYLIGRAVALTAIGLGAIFTGAAVWRHPKPAAQGTAACFSHKNVAQIKADASGLREAFDFAQSLPLSGVPVLKKLQAHQTCIAPGQVDERSIGTINGNKAHVTAGSRETVYMHEWFHLTQADALARGAALRPDDARFLYMLMEANAVAYQLMAEQEAITRGLNYQPRLQNTVADSIPLRQAFSIAYEAARDSTAPFQNENAREANALSQGAQAAVRFLLEGNISEWKKFYEKRAGEAVVSKEASKKFKNENEYIELRTKIYSDAGRLSGLINITPEEFKATHTGKMRLRLSSL